MLLLLLLARARSSSLHQISVEPIGTEPVAELPPDNWVKEGGAEEEKPKQFKVQNPKKAEAVVQ